MALKRAVFVDFSRNREFISSWYFWWWLWCLHSRCAWPIQQAKRDGRPFGFHGWWWSIVCCIATNAMPRQRCARKCRSLNCSCCLWLCWKCRCLAELVPKKLVLAFLVSFRNILLVSRFPLPSMLYRWFSVPLLMFLGRLLYTKWCVHSLCALFYSVFCEWNECEIRNSRRRPFHQLYHTIGAYKWVCTAARASVCIYRSYKQQATSKERERRHHVNDSASKRFSHHHNKESALFRAHKILWRILKSSQLSFDWSVFSEFSDLWLALSSAIERIRMNFLKMEEKSRESKSLIDYVISDWWSVFVVQNSFFKISSKNRFYLGAISKSSVKSVFTGDFKISR